MAQVFGAPVVIKSPLRDGSMRQAALEQGVSTLVYESGEALRFDEFGIRIGVKGVLRVMAKLGMIPKTASMAKGQPSAMASKTKWVRAAQSGILRSVKNTGHQVENDEVLGYVSDPFGETEASVLSPFSGIIIGRTNLPTVNQGDALFHVAHVPRAKSVENAMDIIEEEIEGEPLFDEDEIV